MTIDQQMEKIYPEWRYRWCEAKVCYCLGCVNVAGKLKATKEEWQAWVNDHKTSPDHELHALGGFK